MDGSIYGVFSWLNRSENNLYFPIFIGNSFAYVTCGSKDQCESSPPYNYDLDHHEINEILSPDINHLMSCVAECLETYGGMSACYMTFDDEIYLTASDDQERDIMMQLFEKYNALLTPVYKKYGLEDIWG